jgi:hypothetical protein
VSRRRSTFVPKRASWISYRLLNLRLGFLAFLTAAEQDRDEVAS